MNCWEFKKCGREAGGIHEGRLGACPAATNDQFHGCNGGVNAGRSCWMVAGTFCDNERQGTFLEKSAGCRKCDFYRLVESEGQGLFIDTNEALLEQSSRLHGERTVSSQENDQKTILYLLEQLFSREQSRTVPLVNIYKELPISNPGEIVDINGSHVVIATNQLQMAAINACQETFIGIRACSTFILGHLTSYEIRRSTVTLSNFSYAQLYTNLRKTVRVRLPKPLNVVMHAGGQTISGVIRDISFGGCALNTLTTAGLDGAGDLALKLKLLEPGTSQVLEADVPCSVVRIVNDHSPYKVALSFCHSAQSEKVVAKFVHQREIEIVKELRESL